MSSEVKLPERLDVDCEMIYDEGDNFLAESSWYAPEGFLDELVRRYNTHANLLREVEELRKVASAAGALREHLIVNFSKDLDVPDEIWVPFTEAIDAMTNK